MKLIESKVEYIPQEEGLDGIYKQIELCGRTCYKSEDKIVNVISIDIANLPEGITVKNIPNYKTNQQQCIEYLRNHKIKYQIISSAKDFVDRMIKSKHGAALEHGTVYLFYAVSCYDIEGQKLVSKYESNPYSKVIYVGVDDNEPAKDGNYYNLMGNEACGHEQYVITTNYRVLVENNWLDDLQYLCSPTEFHEKRYTFKFTTSIGITRELNRHRVNSIAEQSTRYCNYSKDKFGNEITFIIPVWMDIPEGMLDGHRGLNRYYRIKVNDSERSIKLNPHFFNDDWNKGKIYTHWLDSLDSAETTYFEMLDYGWKPQQAREVLPLCTATEVCYTGFASDFRHLLDLRYFEKTGAVHPDMKDLMNKFAQVAQNAHNAQDITIWDDIMSNPSKFD